MRRFTLLFAAAFGLALALFACAVLIIDPYGMTNLVSIEGFNARKTRLKEDGGRIAVSHALLTTRAGSIVLGDSRAVDGFPETEPGWPGGLINAGMRGANAFEIGRAAIVAAENPNLRCALIGVDMFVFSTEVKAKATYWLSALPDGNRALSIARTALAPQPFLRAVQTVIDNATAAEPKTLPWAARYRPGWQRQRLFRSLPSTFDAYKRLVFDPERVAYLRDAIDALTARGVQVIIFTYPAHVFREEALRAAGRAPLSQRVRVDMARIAEDFAPRPARAPCVSGPIAQAWDFTGYQPIATTPPPSPDQEVADAYWHESPHFTPAVGEAILARLEGRPQGGVFDPENFGVRLDGADLAAVQAAAAARRAQWLQTAPHASWVEAQLAAAARRPSVAGQTHFYINRDDRIAMARAVRRLKRESAAR